MEQNIQMHSVKETYVITKGFDNVIDSNLTSSLCKKIVTPLIDSLAFLSLFSSELDQFWMNYLKSRLPEKSLAKKYTSKIRIGLWRWSEQKNWYH